MRILMFALSLLLAFPALSQDIIVSKSASPSCRTFDLETGETLALGYETYYRVEGRKGLFHRQCDFLGNPYALMGDIGMPTRYEDTVNTTGLPKPATHVKILPNGHIKLY